MKIFSDFGDLSDFGEGGGGKRVRRKSMNELKKNSMKQVNKQTNKLTICNFSIDFMFTHTCSNLSVGQIEFVKYIITNCLYFFAYKTQFLLRQSR